MKLFTLFYSSHSNDVLWYALSEIDLEFRVSDYSCIFIIHNAIFFTQMLIGCKEWIFWRFLKDFLGNFTITLKNANS